MKYVVCEHVMDVFDDEKEQACRGGDDLCGGCWSCLLQQASYHGATTHRIDDNVTVVEIGSNAKQPADKEGT